MQVSGAGGAPELLIPANEGEDFYGPQMLPGGEWVLFTVRSSGQSWDEAQIVAQSVATGERVVLIDGGRDGRYVPTGHLLYDLNGALVAVPFDVDSRVVTGRPVPLVEGVRESTGNQGAAQFSVSNTGSLVYIPAPGALSLTWVGLDGNAERIAASPRAYGHPRVSPDGTRVAVDVGDRDDTDVWIWDLEGERLTQLTFDAGVDDLALLTVEGERTEMLLEAEFSEKEPALSPNGRWLAYLTGEGQGPAVYVRPFPNVDDGQWNVSVGYGAIPVWSPDGRELFYRNQTDLMVVQVETEPTFRSSSLSHSSA